MKVRQICLSICDERDNMKFTKEEVKATVSRHEYIMEWVSGRLDSMLGEETRYSVGLEFDSALDVEINWTDYYSEHQYLKVSWAELEDETNETFAVKEAERQAVAMALAAKQSRERAERELRAAEREYNRARTAATEMGVA